MKLPACFALVICCSLLQPHLPSSCSASCELALNSAQSSGIQPQQPAVDETWRRRPPAPKPSGILKLPPAREIKLPNGLTLILVDDHRAPIVTIDVAVPVGELNDPPRMTGLAEATADLLTEGAGRLTSKELTRDVERLGGRISSSSSPDYSEVSATVLAENVGQITEIVGDVLLRPTFPEEEVALFKDTRIEKLTVERQDPAFVVSEEFNKIIYGAHPYAPSAPTPESVSAMTRSSIHEFYDSNYGPDGSYLVSVGDFDPVTMESRLRSIFGGWRARPKAPAAFTSPPLRSEKTIYLIDRPGSDQADIRIGNLALKRSAPDFFPLMIANTILGGGTSSRLFLNLREQKGYTYDVSSSLVALQHYGTFFGATEARNEVCAQAITEILAEFDRIRKEKVPAEELQNAKNYIYGNYSLLLSTQAGLADQIMRSRLLGLDPDFLQTMRSRVESVTADQVMDAARRYILADRPAIVVVGDAARLKKPLESLAPIVVSRGEGNPVK
jgi:zinc protease